MKGRLRLRLSIATAAFVAAVSVLVMAGVYWLTASALERDRGDSVREELRVLAERWRKGGLDDLVAEVKRRSSGAEWSEHAYFLAQEQQTRIAGNLRSWPEGHPVGGEALRASVEVRQADVWLVKRVHLQSMRLDDHQLLVGRDVSDDDAMLATLQGAAAVGVGIGAVLAVAAGLAVGRGLLGRVETMRVKIADILGGARGERVAVGTSGDEFDELATQFNRLLDENERLLAQVREATNNIAHDLRTPLQRMHGRLEAALASAGHEGERPLLEALSGETDRLLETFNGLLQIAQVESHEIRAAMRPTSIGGLIDDLVDLYEPLAEDGGLALRVEVEPELVVLAERQLLGQALANLVDNAIKYAGGEGEISIEARRTGDRVVVAVGDHGPGIPESEREHVLERLVRLDHARSVPGTGLGLSFVAAVARLHGCVLELRDNEPGLRVELSLPPASVVP